MPCWQESEVVKRYLLIGIEYYEYECSTEHWIRFYDSPPEAEKDIEALYSEPVLYSKGPRKGQVKHPPVEGSYKILGGIYEKYKIVDLLEKQAELNNGV